jgi:hypothetical protein
MRRKQYPALTMPIGPVRADTFRYLAEQVIPELSLTPGPVQAASPGRLHTAPDRLPVHPRQPGHGAKPLTPHPQPQHFPDLVHPDLPERHRCPSQIPLNGPGSECEPGSGKPSLPRPRVVP